MMKRRNIVGALGILLVLVLGLSYFLWRGSAEIPDQSGQEVPTLLKVEPFDLGDGSPPIWIFDQASGALMETMLFAPVREKLGLTDVGSLLSSCPSRLDYSLSSLGDEVLLLDGYYYGTLQIFESCDNTANYVFLIKEDGSGLQVTNELGEFLDIEVWLAE